MIRINGEQLNQWDVGRSVTVDVEGATHVLFANQGDSWAPIMALTDKTAQIPQYLLETGKMLLVNAVKETKAEGVVSNRVTLEATQFPVAKQPKPEDYVYGDDRRNYVYQLIVDAEQAKNAANTAANAATTAANYANSKGNAASDAAAEAARVARELLTAKENGEFNGPQGPQGNPGSTPYIGENGNWWIGTTDTGISASGGSGGVSALIVTVSGNVANYSVQDIADHLYNGGVAYLYDAENGCRLPLSVVNESAYASYIDEEGFWHIYEIYNENSVATAVYEYVVQEQLGDISTALDGIIAIQNELIGGDA